MGGGNGQKSAAARAKNAKKADKEKKSKSGGGLAAIQKSRDAFKCIRCMQTFGCTVKKPELEAHCESKHPKHGFEVAFPDYDKTLAILKTPKNAPKSAEEKKTKKKRNGYAKRIG